MKKIIIYSSIFLLNSCQIIKDKLLKDEKTYTILERETFSIENKCSNDLDSIKLYVDQAIEMKGRTKMDSAILKMLPKNTLQSIRISQEKVKQGYDGGFQIIAYYKDKVYGPYTFGYFSNGYFSGAGVKKVILYDNTAEYESIK